jgi:hypothetical protein
MMISAAIRLATSPAWWPPFHRRPSAHPLRIHSAIGKTARILIIERTFQVLAPLPAGYPRWPAFSATGSVVLLKVFQRIIRCLFFRVSHYKGTSAGRATSFPGTRASIRNGPVLRLYGNGKWCGLPARQRYQWHVYPHVDGDSTFGQFLQTVSGFTGDRLFPRVNSVTDQ